MMDKYWTDIKHWAMHPYNEEGNILDWVLFFGFMVSITYLWTRVIRRIID